MGAAVLNVFGGEPRTYGYVLPMPMFETVTGTQSSCVDPEDEGDAFGGAGNTGGGSPDQTWAWTLVPSS